MEHFLIRSAEYGLGIILLGVFFIPVIKWFLKRDKEREMEMLLRLDRRESDSRDARISHIADLRSVVVNNTDAVRSLSQILRNRPCLEEESSKAFNDNKLLIKEVQGEREAGL